MIDGTRRHDYALYASGGSTSSPRSICPDVGHVLIVPRVTTNECVRSFLSGFRINYMPPELGTVALKLTEMASFVSILLKGILAVAAEGYGGIPWLL